MAAAGGIGATWGFGEESTPGTAVAPTKWFEFQGETFALEQNVLQGEGMRGGGMVARASRRTVPTVTAGGEITGDLPTAGVGLLWKHMLGGTPLVAQQGGTAAYQQVHVPGALTGKSLTIQKGVPDASGTVRPFTYRGSKVTEWSLSCSTGEIASLSVTFDSWNEDTAAAYTTPSYSASTGVFDFSRGTIYVGGTVATASGIATRTGGTAVGTVKAASVTGSNHLKTDRYFFGASGVKAEQIEAGWREYSGSLTAEFGDLSLYNLFKNNTQSVVELLFTGSVISGAYSQTMSVLLPATYFSSGSPAVSGPDIIDQTLDFDVKDDGVNAPIQVRIISTDTTP